LFSGLVNAGLPAVSQVELVASLDVATRFRQQLPILVVAAVATVLNAWSLGSVGWGNAYYTAAVRSMSQNWHAFLYNSLDSAGFVSVDKPPLSLWVQTVSVRVFGFSKTSVLMPQVVAGTLAVVVLYAAVRSVWGRSAGLVAAAALAVSPINVMVNHSNNTDSVLVLVMVCGAALAIVAARRGRLSWLLLAAVVAGSAMTAKMLAGVPVLPGVLVAYLWCAPIAWRKRVWHSAAGLVAMAVAGLWWFTLVDLTPASSRPYVGSSPTNSAFQLAFERNGVGQVDGQQTIGPGGAGIGRGQIPGGGFPGGRPGGAPVVPGGALGGALPGGAPDGAPGGGFPGGAAVGGIPNGRAPGGFPGAAGGPGGFGGRGFSGGVPGVLRLLNADLGTQGGWLLPLAVLGLVAGLWRTGLRGSPKLAAIIVFGGWALTAGGVFSITKGIVHPYYLANLGPPIGALAAIGLASTIPELITRSARSALVLIGAAGAAVAQWMLVTRAEWKSWEPAVKWLMAAGVAAGLMLAVAALVRANKRLARMAGAALTLGLLVLPAAWTRAGVSHAVSPALPYASPTATGLPSATGGLRPNGGFSFPAGDQTRLVAYLRANRTTETWLVGVQSAAQAEGIIIDHNEPVMAMGGFIGSDPILTAETLRAKVRVGAVRFFLLPAAGGREGFPGGFPGGGGLPGGGNAASTYVTTSCGVVPTSEWGGSETAVPGSGPGEPVFPNGPTGGQFNLYDCTKRP
jgi:4-amino-4-deoxy-L-arabinose transferase-like glycosyltransferase